MGRSKELFMEERELQSSVSNGYYRVADGQYEYWDEFFHINGKKVVSIFQNKEKPGLNRREIEVKVMSKESFNIIKNVDLEPIDQLTFDQALEQAISQFKM